jgi:hypothetical protein
MPQGQTRKQRKAHDEKRSKKPSAAWETPRWQLHEARTQLGKTRWKRSCRLCSAVILVDSDPLVPAGALNDPRHRCTELLGSATEELLTRPRSRPYRGALYENRFMRTVPARVRMNGPM